MTPAAAAAVAARVAAAAPRGVSNRLRPGRSRDVVGALALERRAAAAPWPPRHPRVPPAGPRLARRRRRRGARCLTRPCARDPAPGEAGAGNRSGRAAGLEGSGRLPPHHRGQRAERHASVSAPRAPASRPAPWTRRARSWGRAAARPARRARRPCRAWARRRAPPMRAGRSPSRRPPSPASTATQQAPAGGAGGAKARARRRCRPGRGSRACRARASRRTPPGRRRGRLRHVRVRRATWRRRRRAPNSRGAVRALGGAASPAWRPSFLLCCLSSTCLSALAALASADLAASWRSPCPSSWRRRRRRWRRRGGVSSPRASASSTLRLSVLFQWFLMALSVPGRRSRDLRPRNSNARCAMTSARSSSRDHLALDVGVRWRTSSRHCLPRRRGAAERSSTTAHAESANELDDLRPLLRSGPFTSSGFRTFSSGQASHVRASALGCKVGGRLE